MCAMWNSTKPIKSSRLEKLTNQSTLNKAQVIEIINACIVAFMKARNSLVVSWREKKKNERCILWKLYFAKIFLLTWKKLFMADLLSNGLHEKVMICYIIMLYY